MSFIKDALFGESPEAISQANILGHFPQASGLVTSGLDISTPTSALDAKTGGINIDPLGRELNLDALNTFSTSLGDTRNRMLDNRNPFVNARVAPLMERLAAGRGQLERGLGRTGVRGTFRDRSLQDFDINAGRVEGDARALAERETEQSLMSIDQALFGAGTGVGQNIFNQELQALGLSAGTINNLLALAANLTTGTGSAAVASQNNVNTNEIRRGENVAGFVGGFLNPAPAETA